MKSLKTKPFPIKYKEGKITKGSEIFILKWIKVMEVKENKSRIIKIQVSIKKFIPLNYI